VRNYLTAYLRKLSSSGSGPDFASVTCRYGKFTIYCIVGPEENIVQLTFAPEKHERSQQLLKSLHHKVSIRTVRQKEFYFDAIFADYFSGRLRRFQITSESPLVAAGTAFQKRIWRHIGEIPYGSSITYQKLAELAGSPRGPRAAANACGANPLALIIPCHRVVAVKGLGGFAGGVAVKKALLGLEQSGVIL
jgi:O-6-methylguanine DNA methyltransferase